MSLSVNTNVQSLSAQRSLAASSNEVKTAMERLSSGKRINSAADDAAGSAMADRMTAQINGLNAAIKNANEAQSLLDTAQSMYADQTDLIQRVRELAVQAANDTNSATDRQFLHDEAMSLVAEVQRITDQTTFNGERVQGSTTFQIGADSGQSVVTFISSTSGYTGGIESVATATTGAGTTTFEVMGDSSNGPFVTGDAIVFGDELDVAYFVISAGSATNNSDGTFVQSIDLVDASGNARATSVAAGTWVGAVGTTNFSPGNYTLGGRGSLYRIDLVNDASAALSDIDRALENTSSYRANVGALQNRLEYTVSNLMNVSEYTTAARSRIEDADFAAESARLAKAQVLQQSGTAMLSQANASSQLVLSLVR